MDKHQRMKEITEILINRLKIDIMSLHFDAIKANDEKNREACKVALEKEDRLLNNLIKLVETFNRKFG